MWKNLIGIWQSDTLLKQAWDQSIEMLDLSMEFFTEALISLRGGENKEEIKQLKKRDKEINRYQKEVRQKVVTYFSAHQEAADIHSGLTLLSIVIDIERLGDYTKNILDLAISHKSHIISEDISENMKAIEKEIVHRFEKTKQALQTQDEESAEALLRTYRKDVSQSSEQIVNEILSGEKSYGSEDRAAAIALYARYLKRLGSHLKNMTSTIVNPYDTIGYID